jgi:ribosome-associated protein
MARTIKKGYYVRGQFVAEGSDLDLQLKRELKGDGEISKTDLKRESSELQKIGEDLMNLRPDLMQPLDLPEKLKDAIAAARGITNFEGKRRQIQFIGKLMRQLDHDQIEAAKRALAEQYAPSVQDTLLLHEAEHWRDQLLADEDAASLWLTRYPETDSQQMRALIRQARKDLLPTDAKALGLGLAPRQTRSYRELFQLIKQQLTSHAQHPTQP